MGQKTYALYKDEIYNWVDLLDELGLSHNNSQSAHIEFDKYAIQNKKLQSAKVMIKNEDDEFVEAVKNKYGEYVKKEIKNIKKYKKNSKNKDEDKSIKTSNGRKRPTNAQLPNGEIISWVSLLERYNLDHNKKRSAHDEWDEYFEYKKGLPNIKEVPKNDDIIYKNGKNDKVEIENEYNDDKENIYSQISNENYRTSNGKKIVTRAKLPNREVITWVDLLKRYNLDHNPRRSAYEEWLEYKRKDTKGLLPKVDRVDSDGNIVPDKPRRDPISQTDKFLLWELYFPDVTKGLCPCCKKEQISFRSFVKGHNKPHSKGGTEDIDNLVPICKPCNDGMGDRYTIEEYSEKLKNLKNLKSKLFDLDK